MVVRVLKDLGEHWRILGLVNMHEANEAIHTLNHAVAERLSLHVHHRLRLLTLKVQVCERRPRLEPVCPTNPNSLGGAQAATCVVLGRCSRDPLHHPAILSFE